MKRFLVGAGALLIAACAAQPNTAASGNPASSDVVKGYAPIYGLNFYYEIHGKPDGKPPLLLLHGGDPCWETSFEEVMPRLAAHRQVIAFDQAGHGRTADRDAPFSFRQSADDAAALLEYLHVREADWYGYSNGGQIAIEAALRYPQSVRRLVLQSAMWSRAGSPEAFWKGFEHTSLDTMPPGLREAYLKTAVHPENLQSYFDKSVARMREFKGWSAAEIASIKAPALVIIGDRDIVLPEHALDTVRLLPRAQLAILPNTDHMQMAHRADLLAPMIQAFLDARDGRP